MGAAVAYAWTKNAQYAGADTKGSIDATGDVTILSKQNSGEAMKLDYTKDGMTGVLHDLGLKFDKTAKAYVFSAGATWGGWRRLSSENRERTTCRAAKCRPGISAT